MPYELEHDPIDSGQLVRLSGELDLAACGELATVLSMMARSPGTFVVLDLAAVTFIDSSALGTIMRAGREIEAAGKDLRIVCDDGPVRSLLELTNLTGRFALYPTAVAALADGVAQPAQGHEAS